MHTLYTIDVQAPTLTELEQKIQTLIQATDDVCLLCELRPEHIHYADTYLHTQITFGQLHDHDPLLD